MKSQSDSLGSTIKVLLVIPVYNEERFIEQSVTDLQRYILEEPLLRKKYNFSILLAEDGSTDATLNILLGLSTRYDNIVIRHYSDKLGRGKAIKNAWNSADADIYAYFDADMPVKLTHLSTLIESCSNQEYDLVTGSRYVEGSIVNRPPLRNIVSKAYNLLVRFLFKTGIKDHQCGFKAVKRKMRDLIIRQSVFDDWFWDTEMFVIARRNGLCVLEFPVKWEETRTKRTCVRRLLNDILIHGSDIVRLLIKDKIEAARHHS
jgi:glycosyltransferase AglD